MGDTHTHTPGRAHTGGEAPWPRMHTLTHMPTNNTHTPPPQPHPGPATLLASGTCSVDLGHAATGHTEAHAALRSQHRSLLACPHTGGNWHQLPAHLCLACSEGHLHGSRGDRPRFLRVPLSYLHPRTLCGSLLPMALSPNKTTSSVDFEVSPTCSTPPRAIFLDSSSFYLHPALASSS